MYKATQSVPMLGQGYWSNWWRGATPAGTIPTHRHRRHYLEGAQSVPMLGNVHVFDLGDSIGYYDELGSPLSIVKKVGRGVASGAKTVGKGVARGAKFVGQHAFNLAVSPIRHFTNQMISRRAAKIAWDRRKSRQPMPAEVAEAKAWSKNQMKAKGPHGKLIALLMGPPVVGAFGQVDPVSQAAIVSASAALAALASQTLKSLAKGGSAPDPAALQQQIQDYAAKQAEAEAARRITQGQKAVESGAEQVVQSADAGVQEGLTGWGAADATTSKGAVVAGMAIGTIAAATGVFLAMKGSGPGSGGMSGSRRDWPGTWSRTRKPTIYETLRKRLGREPTDAELSTEVRRIIHEGNEEGRLRRGRGRTFTGSGDRYRPGERVQLHPAASWWMRGARYGEVVSQSGENVRVRLDRTGRVVKLAARDILETV
jgi:hypothetical protein